jgi:hypothetical protein
VQLSATLTSTSKASNYELTNGSSYQLTGQTIAQATPTAAHLGYDLSAVTYNGAPHPVAVAPKKGLSGMGAITVKYDGSAVAPTGAGAYAVAVEVGEGANFEAATLPLGSFSINRAPQAITFEPPQSLEVEGGSYTLAAWARTTGGAPELPVRLRLGAGGEELADMAGSVLTLKQTGEITVTAFVEPNPNYEDAAEVLRTVALTSSSTAAHIEVDGATAVDELSYTASNPEPGAPVVVTVTITPKDRNAKVIFSGEAKDAPFVFPVSVERGGKHQLTYRVISQDGTREALYPLLLEVRLPAEAYLLNEENVAFLLNLERLQLERYDPSSCRWYCNGELVGTGFAYGKRMGSRAADQFLPGELYHFELDTPDGVVRSTEYYAAPPPPPPADAAALRAYPNPVQAGQPVRLRVGGGAPDGAAPGSLRGAWIRAYAVEGTPVLQQRAASANPEVRLPKIGAYFIRVNGKTVKVVVVK